VSKAQEKKDIIVPKTILVRENLWIQLKVIAARRNITLSELGEEAFDDYARKYGENHGPQ